MVDRVILSPKIATQSHQAKVFSNIAQIRENLTTDTLTWTDKSKKYTLAVKDIVGVSHYCETSDNPIAGFVVHAYPFVRGIAGKCRRLQEYYFACPDFEKRSQWVTAINNTLAGLPIEAPQNPTQRHLHILLNPASGKKKAWRIFQQVRTVWDKSNIELTVSQTTNTNQARQIIQTLAIEKLHGLVIIGGDGTLYEVINGLMSRPDWESAIQIPIGTISAGTGNGLCKTLLELAGEPYDPISAAFLIAKGKMRPLDLVMVEQEHRRYYSFLSISWGFVSDVDIESDRWRFLGTLKNTIYALLRILSLRRYKGRLSFIPVANWTPNTKNECQSLAECSYCCETQLETNLSHSQTQIIEDEFVLFWAMNVVWASHDLKPTPYAHLSDGAVDLLIVRKGISRSQLLRAFLLCANGKHLSIPYVEYYKVSSFELEPLTKRGIFAIDGERVNYSPMQVRVLRGVANVFAI